MKKVLVLCTGNSCRSQMAEGYLRHFGGEHLDVFSAGIEAHGVNPRAVAILAEDGIDISRQTSNKVVEYLGLAFDYIITVCDNARERCPVFPARAKVIHHTFPDPAKAQGSEAEVLEQFRQVRDAIKAFSRQFASDVA